MAQISEKTQLNWPLKAAVAALATAVALGFGAAQYEWRVRQDITGAVRASADIARAERSEVLKYYVTRDELYNILDSRLQRLEGKIDRLNDRITGRR